MREKPGRSGFGGFFQEGLSMILSLTVEVLQKGFN